MIGSSGQQIPPPQLFSPLNFQLEEFVGKRITLILEGSDCGQNTLLKVLPHWGPVPSLPEEDAQAVAKLEQNLRMCFCVFSMGFCFV